MIGKPAARVTTAPPITPNAKQLTAHFSPSNSCLPDQGYLKLGFMLRLRQLQSHLIFNLSLMQTHTLTHLLSIRSHTRT